MLRRVYKKIIWLFLLISSCGILSGQKTDKIYLVNGDILTGEIKSLAVGLLHFDLDGPGIIDVKWERIKAFRSDRIFEVMFVSGEVMVTRPDSSFFAEHQVNLEDIVEMYPIKSKFIKRLNGNVNTGINYTKSSKILEFNFDGEINYRIPKLELGLNVSSYVTNKSGDSSIAKELDVKYATTVYFGKLFLTGGAFEWQQNTELGLANRFSVNGLIGKLLLVDDHNRLSASTGMSLNKEQSFESNSYKTNVEIPFLFLFKRFFYSAPKQSIDAMLNTYPSISNWGRVRMEFSLSTSVEIFKDFIVGVNFYDKFDNRPPEGAISTNDYGITFTLGYKFGK